MWTGTNSDGTRSDFTCQGFNPNSAMVSGTFGFAGDPFGPWTHKGPDDCNVLNHIYCFQLPLRGASAPLLSGVGERVALCLVALFGGAAELWRRRVRVSS